MWKFYKRCPICGDRVILDSFNDKIVNHCLNCLWILEINQPDGFKTEFDFPDFSNGLPEGWVVYDYCPDCGEKVNITSLYHDMPSYNFCTKCDWFKIVNHNLDIKHFDDCVLDYRGEIAGSCGEPSALTRWDKTMRVLALGMYLAVSLIFGGIWSVIINLIAIGCLVLVAKLFNFLIEFFGYLILTKGNLLIVKRGV